MNVIAFLLDFILHMDRYLGQIVASTGSWTYVILFVVIFIETGLVVTPFLPGDSILFATGALIASQGVLDVKLVYILVVVAAVLGDTANYWIGHFIGERVFHEEHRFLKKEYLDRTNVFTKGKSRQLKAAYTQSRLPSSIATMEYPRLAKESVALPGPHPTSRIRPFSGMLDMPRISSINAVG